MAHNGEDSQIYVADVEGYINNIVIHAEFKNASNDNQIRVYYISENDYEFSADKCKTYSFNSQISKIDIELDESVTALRIDITEQQGVEIFIKNIEINETSFSISKMDVCIFAVILIFCTVIYYYRKIFMEFFFEREMLIMLVKNDLKARYAGSFLGLVWAFAQPVMTILVFWIVFQLGFRQAPVDNTVFILWFTPAYVAWIYFQDAVVNTSSCLREYSYLVKKMKFPVHMLPIMKVFSSLIIHVFFILLVFIIFFVYRYSFSISLLQLIYYVFALTFLLVGLSWLTAAITVFVKDFSQVISILLQIGFFMMPIFWNEATMDPMIVALLKLNPLFYIVQGYRDALLGGEIFWNKPEMTIYYWIVSIVVFIGGVKLFNKSRRHFADLL